MIKPQERELSSLYAVLPGYEREYRIQTLGYVSDTAMAKNNRIPGHIYFSLYVCGIVVPWYA